jgi:DNA-binding transcriptional ArsR family regulator
MLRPWPNHRQRRPCYCQLVTAGIDIAAVAALVGDPGRANMLAVLLDGRAHTATELARLAHVAGIAAPTASGHLAKLQRGRLVTVAVQGRHRYYRLASADVARMLEGIMVVAAEPLPATRRIDPALRRARTCYDHLAGELGVAIADALIARGVIDFSNDGATVTDKGRALLSAAAISVEQPGRRPYCRPCLDWSERRPHLAGVLGAALLERALKKRLVRRREGSRALHMNGTKGDVLRRLDIG